MKIKRKFTLLILTALATFSGIGSFWFSKEPGTIEVAEYMQWIENEDNGLRVSKTVGNFEFNLQYKPLEYIVLLDKRKEEVSEEELNEGKREFEGLEYYTLSIGSNDKQTGMLKTKLNRSQSHDDRIAYFSYEMQKDLSLIVGVDTLPCTLFHFERTYSLKSNNNFVLAFEIPDKLKSASQSKALNRTLIYNDRALNTGSVKLKIAGEDLNNIPKLKM